MERPVRPHKNGAGLVAAGILNPLSRCLWSSVPAHLPDFFFVQSGVGGKFLDAYILMLVLAIAVPDQRQNAAGLLQALAQDDAYIFGVDANTLVVHRYS